MIPLFFEFSSALSLSAKSLLNLPKGENGGPYFTKNEKIGIV